jgi:hypothetical protein
MEFQHVSGPPGTETSYIVDQVRIFHQHQKIAILAKTHEELGEIKEKLEEIGLFFRHWKGIKKMCPSDETLIRTMIKANMPNGIVCGRCKAEDSPYYKDCPFHEQHKDLPNIILCPLVYVNTIYLVEYEPDRIIMKGLINEHFEVRSLLQLVEDANQFHKYGMLPGLPSVFGRTDYTIEDFRKHPGSLTETYRTLSKIYKTYIETFSMNEKFISPVMVKALIGQFEDEETEEIWIPPNINHFRYQANALLRYGKEAILVYYLEALLDQFGDKEVTVIDTYTTLRERVLSTCKKDLGEEIEVNDVEIEDPETVGSVFYRVMSNRGVLCKYTKKYLVKSLDMRDKIKNDIGIFITNHYKKTDLNILLITHKDTIIGADGKYRPERYIQEKYGDIQCHVRCSYFGKYARIDDVDLIIQIGAVTPNLHDLKKDYEALTHQDVEESVIKDDREYKYIDEELEAYRENYFETFRYWNDHKGRPLKKEIEVLCFGPTSERIKDEVDYQYVWIGEDEVYTYDDVPEMELREYVRRMGGRVSVKDSIEWLGKTYPFFGQSDRQLWKRVRRYAERHPNLMMVDGVSDGSVGRPPKMLITLSY